MAATAMAVTELMERAQTWPVRAQSLQVVDPETLEMAGEELHAVKDLMAEIDGTFDPIIKKQYEAHKEACAQKKRHREPLEQAEAIYKQAIGTYTAEQERQRQLAEAAAREAEERRLAELREKEIEQAEQQGASPQEVKAIAEAPLPPMRVIAPPPAAKVAGISTRETWQAEVTDMAAFVRHVAANPQYVSLLAVNQTALNNMAKAMKTTMQIPGVRAFTTTTVSARKG